ncbi:unnamed protein product [Moneuplotes crassus]|uniref:Uncharacterized protein n=1 Tax=Euplotes crassus TaxID=5936 RepID=A0AAD2CV62_EUPCR|nr:unnamed protein product [Moneuplotes crassus]
MSQPEEGSKDDHKENERLVKRHNDGATQAQHKTWNILTESILLVASIPSVIFSIFGLVNGLLLLIQQDDHQKCVATKKIAAIAAGKNASSISDHMEDHLTGSTVVLWVLIVIYTQILFSISMKVYPFCGFVYIICLLGGLVYHIVGIIWVLDEDCTDTDWYILGIANSIIFFIFFVIILVGALICFLIGLSGSKSQKVKPEEKEDNAEISEERILENEEAKRGNHCKNKGQNDKHDTEDKDRGSSVGQTSNHQRVTKDKDTKGNKEEETEEKDNIENKDEEEEENAGEDEEEIY